MRRCKCQMHRVRHDAGWYDLLVKKSGYQCVHFSGGTESGQAVQCSNPFGGKNRIASSGFFQHGFRDEQLVFVPVQLPPFLCGFLFGSEPEIATSSRYEVTRNGRFNVKPGLHFWNYAATGCSLPEKNCFNHFIAARNPMGRTSASE